MLNIINTQLAIYSDRVEANEVREGEGAHGHVTAELHGRVNILPRAQSLLYYFITRIMYSYFVECVEGLVEVRAKQTIGNEARVVGALGRRLSHLLRERERHSLRLLVRQQPRNHFHELHDRHRVHLHSV